MRREFLTGLIGLVLICSVGCIPSDKPAANAPATNAANTTPVVNSANASNSANNAPVSSLPKEKTVDLQANHPNGTVMRVSKVSFSDDGITVEFAVTNGYEYEIKLAQGGMQMRDNLGNVYNLSPPPQDADISVAPDNNLKGKLTFLGRVAPNAASLTLTTNYKYNNRDSEYDRSPTLVISNIPIER